MVEVMNRASRRAAKAGRPKPEVGIYVLPMELTEPYLLSNIVREGVWNEAPPVIVMRPKEEFGRADDAWFGRTLGQMRQVRKPGTLRFCIGEDGVDLDVGLIDIQVYFEADAARRNSDRVSDSRFYDENFRLVDELTGGELHTQMVLATAVHRYRPDGSYGDHYHNLIFGLRRQIDGSREHLGVLDLVPVLKALGDGRTLNIIEEL
jgi:hypothetical protein